VTCCGEGCPGSLLQILAARGAAGITTDQLAEHKKTNEKENNRVDGDLESKHGFGATEVGVHRIHGVEPDADCILWSPGSRESLVIVFCKAWRHSDHDPGRSADARTRRFPLAA